MWFTYLLLQDCSWRVVGRLRLLCWRQVVWAGCCLVSFCWCLARWGDCGWQIAHLDYHKILCSWYRYWQQIVLVVVMLRQLLLAEHLFYWLLSVEQIVCVEHLHISLDDYSWYKTVLWIRIRIRIRIKVISWIRICINLQMTSQNVWNMSLFEHLNTFSRFWTCIWLGSWSRSVSASASKWQAGTGSGSESKWCGSATLV